MKRRLSALTARASSTIAGTRYAPVLFHVTGVTDGGGYWQGRSSGLPGMRAIRSVEERDVAGRYIHHVNVQRLQRFQHGLDPWPVSAELLSLLRFPFGPRLVREIRRCVQPSSCEIQDEWARDDTHLDDAQPVVQADEVRDIESQNL